MDLDYFYHRYGISLLMARHGACDRSRAVHRAMATGYAERIAGLRRDFAGAIG